MEKFQNDSRYRGRRVLPFEAAELVKARILLKDSGPEDLAQRVQLPLSAVKLLLGSLGNSRNQGHKKSPYSGLVGKKQYEKAMMVKQDMLNEIQKTRIVHLAVDDRKQIVDMWRRNGIMC